MIVLIASSEAHAVHATHQVLVIRTPQRTLLLQPFRHDGRLTPRARFRIARLLAQGDARLRAAVRPVLVRALSHVVGRTPVTIASAGPRAILVGTPASAIALARCRRVAGVSCARAPHGLVIADRVRLSDDGGHDTPADVGPPLALVDDRIALGRVLRSEVGSHTFEERVAIGWVCRNRARQLGLSIAAMVCTPTCGPGGSRPFSSRVAAARQDLALATALLSARPDSDPTHGATAAFEPLLQDQLLAAHRPGYLLDAAGIRARWLSENDFYGVVGRWELFGPKRRRRRQRPSRPAESLSRRSARSMRIPQSRKGGSRRHSPAAVSTPATVGLAASGAPTSFLSLATRLGKRAASSVTRSCRHAARPRLARTGARRRPSRPSSSSRPELCGGWPRTAKPTQKEKRRDHQT